MKKPDVVLRELGQLYDFQSELAKFRFRDERKPRKNATGDREAEPVVRPSAVPAR